MVNTVLGVVCLACALGIFALAARMTDERRARLPEGPSLPGPIGRRTHRRLTGSTRAFLAWRGLFFLVIGVVLLLL